ncbi:hypothetical protein ACSBR1_042676 [Camellia fascicularis]
MFLLSTTLFMNKWNTVGLYLLRALVTLPRVWFNNWGGAGLATLYGYMSSTSRTKGEQVGGYWRAWEVCTTPFCFCTFYSISVHASCFLLCTFYFTSVDTLCLTLLTFSCSYGFKLISRLWLQSQWMRSLLSCLTHIDMMAGARVEAAMI